MRFYVAILCCLLLSAATASGQRPDTTDSSQIETKVVRLLREAHDGGAVQVVPNAGAMLERYAVCRGDSVGANCRLTDDKPVYVISGIKVTGNSATARVTTFRDTPSHGIYLVIETWLMHRRGAGWEKVGIDKSKTIIQ